MIRENQRFLNMVRVIIDLVVITSAFVVAWLIRFETSFFGLSQEQWGFSFYITPLTLILPLYLLLYYLFGLYAPQRTEKSIAPEAGKIIKSNIIGLLMLITLLFVLNLSDYSRYLLALFAILSTVFSITERFVFRKTLRFIRSKGYNVKHILVIGAGELGEKFAGKINKNDQIGYNIIGFLDDNIENGRNIANTEVIGNIEDLDDIILSNHVDKAIITISPRHHHLLESIVDTCEKHGLKAEIIPDYYRYFPAQPHISMIDDIPIINIRNVPLDNSVKNAAKRLFDILFAMIGIIILSPIMSFTAIMIKITSPGPIIYKQERVGLHRKTFEMYKFRSMKVQDQDDEQGQWTTKDDHRKTKFGSFIRKTSIDELPQLFNILKGDMSLIGPRPERPLFVEKFREEIPKYMIKHHVRPGMSGWAQVNGWRGDTCIKRRIEYDIFYVENWTMMLDIKIFFITIIKGFNDKNAY
jgi:Undecaprenyl-phosphate glucose phosphotransferase